MICRLALSISVLSMLVLIAAAAASPDEASGIVTQVKTGDTFMVDGVGCVRLADVKAPETAREALYAQEYTMQTLLNTQVFLDIDNQNNQTGRDENGCLICVVYRAGQNGTPNLNANFNRMLVDAGHAQLTDDKRNEFDPAAWWCGQSCPV
jgi:endonuclease YncB( thermonuclease family)